MNKKATLLGLGGCLAAGRAAASEDRGFKKAALEAAVRTAQDGLRVVQAQYKIGLVGRDKVREAEAAVTEADLAEAQADLYSLKCQRATLLATWRYLTGRAVTAM